MKPHEYTAIKKMEAESPGLISSVISDYLFSAEGIRNQIGLSFSAIEAVKALERACKKLSSTIDEEAWKEYFLPKI